MKKRKKKNHSFPSSPVLSFIPTVAYFRGGFLWELFS